MKSKRLCFTTCLIAFVQVCFLELYFRYRFIPTQVIQPTLPLHNLSQPTSTINIPQSEPMLETSQYETKQTSQTPNTPSKTKLDMLMQMDGILARQTERRTTLTPNSPIINKDQNISDPSPSPQAKVSISGQLSSPQVKANISDAPVKLMAGSSLAFINERIMMFRQEFTDNAITDGLFHRCNQSLEKQMEYNTQYGKTVDQLPTCNQQRIVLVGVNLPLLTFQILGVVIWVRYEGALGTPVGELIQWTDLIHALQILGHNITVLENVPAYEKMAPVLDEQFDLIFCDYHFASRARQTELWTPSLRSKLRVLDTFGTQDYFNMLPVERAKEENIVSTYCCLQIHPAQYYTFYPHTPENTFLGYSVLSWKYHLHSVSSLAINDTIEYSKRNQALVWAKQTRFYSEASEYLKKVGKVFELHGTAGGTLPNWILNHGVLPPALFGVLLEETKLFLGTGFPFDGPSPFEAMARGCIYVNPRYPTPINSQTHKGLAGKPTKRFYTSQHPYLEQFTSHVITINYKNDTEVQIMLDMAQNITSFVPFIPPDFQVGNFIWRVYNLVNNQRIEFQNETFVLV